MKTSTIHRLEHVSIVLLIIVVAGLSFLTLHFVHLDNGLKTTNKTQATQIESQKKQIAGLGALESSSDPLGLNLTACLDSADKWFNTASSAAGLTTSQAQVLLQDKQEQIQECQIRYPN